MKNALQCNGLTQSPHTHTPISYKGLENKQGAVGRGDQYIPCISSKKMVCGCVEVCGE